MDEDVTSEDRHDRQVAQANSWLWMSIKSLPIGARTMLSLAALKGIKFGIAKVYVCWTDN